jgi:crotonobetainyl-CoA:carnitine CoA-transferase CaiB-like acyl-CoA transferase
VPVVPGSTSLADYMSGMDGAIGALVALRAREATGQGQCIDLALYESVFRVLDEIAPAYQKFGYVRERMGADTVNVCPHSHYQTADGKWIAIACTSDQIFARLAEAMEQPELASEARYGPKELRLAARDDVNKIVAQWVASLDCEIVLARCAEGGVPASLIFSIADIFEDPQYRARGNIKMTDSRAGTIAVPNVVPRLSETPGQIRWLGEGLGAHNEEVFRDLLELTSAEIDDLRISGVI